MAKRARGIYKRGMVWWVMFADANGTMHYESSKSQKYEDAVTFLHDRRTEVKEGRESNGNGANHHLADLIDRYKAWMQGRHRSADTKRYRLKDILNYFGSLPLQSLSGQMVEQYQTHLINRGLKPASANKNIGILKAVIRKGVEWQMVAEYIHKRVVAVKLLRENNKRLRYLSREENRTLINVCDGHVKPIVIVALNTGLRRGEILGLRWEQVDLRHGFIHLNTSKNGDRHDIPINKTLRAVLETVPRRDGIPYVFFDYRTGKPFQRIKRGFKTACKKAGITDFHFHDLRHTFASQLVMSGVDIVTVQQLLNHKSLAMTLRYAHLSPNHRTKAVEVLDL